MADKTPNKTIPYLASAGLLALGAVAAGILIVGTGTAILLASGPLLVLGGIVGAIKLKSMYSTAKDVSQAGIFATNEDVANLKERKPQHNGSTVKFFKKLGGEKRNRGFTILNEEGLSETALPEAKKKNWVSKAATSISRRVRNQGVEIITPVDSETDTAERKRDKSPSFRR